MKKIIILGLGVAAFFMQGCDFLDRTPEDIIETGKFFESANANALAYIIHSGFISGYQNRYGDNLKPPTNVYHRMTA